MYRLPVRRLVALTIVATLAACGDSADEARPVELVYFVQGPTGTRFELVGPDDNHDCMAESRDQPAGLVPSAGFGFQSSDASHVLTGVMRAPHFFVIENERQPTRAVFRNLGDAPLTVLQLRGIARPGSTIDVRVIPPGACRSVSSFGDIDEMAGTAPPLDVDNEYRFEVCSFASGVRLPDGFECQDLAPRGTVDRDADGNLLVDAGARFFGTVGDLTASFFTRCLAPEEFEQVDCRTPTTFYMHAPRDQISAAMTRLRDQPDTFLQLDLYRGNQLWASSRAGNDVFVRRDI